jgi:transposase
MAIEDGMVLGRCLRRSPLRRTPIRTLVRRHGAWRNIPPKINLAETLCFRPYLYRNRTLVERFFNKITHCRCIATR